MTDMTNAESAACHEYLDGFMRGWFETPEAEMAASETEIAAAWEAGLMSYAQYKADEASGSFGLKPTPGL